MLAFLRSTLAFIKSTFQFWSGIALTVMTFFGFFYDFKAPELKMEVTAISHGNDGAIDLIKESALPSIKEMISQPAYPFFNIRDMGYDRFVLSQDEISKRILMFKSEVMAESDNIRINEDELYRISKIKDLETKSTALKRLSASNLEVPPLSDDEFNKNDMEEYLNKQVLDYEDTITSKKEQLLKKEKQIKQIESEWLLYIQNTLPDKAKLTVTVAIGNSGDGATSLKPQALFRVNIGDGSYLDFPMKLKGYEQGNSDNASFQPKIYKVVRFESEAVGSMTEKDRERFKTFLGNASPARLYISDVRGNTFSSNSVPFSPGIYEQKAYDLLKQFASSQIN